MSRKIRLSSAVLSAALTVAVTTACADAVTVDGTVFVDNDSDGVFSSGDTPLAGVVVSYEATQFTTTDSEGHYNFDSPAGIVWVRVPDGYRVAPVWGLIDGSSDQTIDLALEPADVTGPLTMVVAADSHMHQDHVDYPAEALTHSVVQATDIDPAPHFITVLGDITQANRPGEFTDVQTSFDAVTVPFVPVPGNHDWYDGGTAYRLNFGPDRYSFDAGGAHHIVLNAMMSDEANLDFVKADLAFSDPDTIVMAYSHAPPTASLAADLDAAGVDYLFTGHWHSNRVVERGQMREYNTQTFIMGGIDFTPGGYRVVSLNGDAVSVYHGTIVENPIVTLTNPPANDCVSTAPVEILAAIEVSATRAQVTARIDGGDPIGLTPDGGWVHRATGPALSPGAHEIVIEAYAGSELKGSSTTTFNVCSETLSGAILVDWPQHQGGPEHHGSTEAEVAPPLRTAWAQSVGGHIQGGSLVVANDKVFVPIVDLADATRGGVVALDARTGAHLWRFTTGYAVRNSPAVEDGKVIFADNNGLVMALDVTNGSEVWRHDLGQGLDQNVRAMYAAPTIVDGVVYVGIQRNFSALDLSTGAVIWSQDPSPQGSWLGSYAAPGVSGGVTIGAFSRGVDGLVGWNTDTGEELWRLPRPAATAVNTSPLIAGRLAYFGRADATMYAVDIDTGELAWGTRLYVGGFDWGYDLGATPAYADGALFIPMQRGSFHALDAVSGAELWSFTAVNESLVHPTHYEANVRAFAASPAVTGNIVWVPGADGRLSALDTGTGEEVWSRELGSPILSGVVPSGDFLFVATYDGTVRALTPATLWIEGTVDPTDPDESGGCGCSVGGDSGPRPGEIGLWLIVLGLVSRRRRRGSAG